MLKILLTVAYEGTNYAGWQRQQNALAVQEVLEKVLTSLFGSFNNPIVTAAASRTDARVHALGQKVTFEVEDMAIPLRNMPQVINARLPKDIAVQSAQFVHMDFNPRFNAKYKTYVYQIYNAPAPNPLLCRYSMFVPQKLDMLKMEQAAACFLGIHDFAAFCATGSTALTTVRTIFNCTVQQEGNIIKIIVTGDGFLYNMVRIIAGTIIYVGRGKIDAAKIPHIIASKKRINAGKTMPPQGLTLMEVCY